MNGLRSVQGGCDVEAAPEEGAAVLFAEGETVGDGDEEGEAVADFEGQGGEEASPKETGLNGHVFVCVRGIRFAVSAVAVEGLPKNLLQSLGVEIVDRRPENVDGVRVIDGITGSVKRRIRGLKRLVKDCYGVDAVCRSNFRYRERRRRRSRSNVSLWRRFRRELKGRGLRVFHPSDFPVASGQPYSL